MQVTIELGERSYPVLIGSGLLKNAGKLLAAHIHGKDVCIVSNETVAPLCLHDLQQELKQYKVSSVILPDGEAFKNLQTLNLIFDHLLKEKQGRDVTLIALGGGVIGDITGFAAACFMRGVNFIQIPTTLLAQVDSSVGGKTGVNHVLGKNMIGAFYQPQCVLADVDVLQSLPKRELSAGLAEVIKYGLIADKQFYLWLQTNMQKLVAGDKETLAHAIKISCECKASVVSSDETEKGLRAILNLGHTFGHAIEAYYQYKTILHGEAVAIGTCMASHLSCQLGLITKQETSEIKTLFLSAGLPVVCEDKIPAEKLYELMKVDKKVQSGQMRLVLLESIGKAIIMNGISEQKILEALNSAMP